MKSPNRRFKDEIYEQFSRIGKAVSSPKRLELLDLLCQGEKNVETLAQEINIPIRDASSITNTILEQMTETLGAGDSIEIRGFGSFVVKKYQSYKGRNPKTGQKISVPPKRLPFFKVGKDLKEKVNK